MKNRFQRFSKRFEAFGRKLKDLITSLIYYDWTMKKVSSEAVTDGVELFDTMLKNGEGTLTPIADGYNLNVSNESGGSLVWLLNIEETESNDCVVSFNADTISGELTFKAYYNGSSVVQLENEYTVVNGLNKIKLGTRVRNPAQALLYWNINTTANINFTSNSVQKVIQHPNQRYIKDEGINPKYPLALYSGQGKYFNGVDSYIPIDAINTTAEMNISFIYSGYDVTVQQSEILAKSDGRARIMANDNRIQIDFRDAGGSADFFVTSELNNFDAVSLNIENGIITSYVNGVQNMTVNQPFSGMVFDRIGTGNYGRFLKGILKDLYVFNRALTEAERTKQYQYPEDFFIDVKTGIIIDCILNMPMNDKDWYVRDYSEYGEGSDITSEFDSGNWTNQSGNFSIVNNKVICSTSDSGKSFYEQNIAIADNIYLIKLVVDSISVGHVNILVGASGSGQINSNGTYYIAVKASSSTHVNIVNYLSDAVISRLDILPLSGIYPIVNPTNDTNDLAKQLPYGLQDSKLVTNSLGVIESKSPFLEQNTTDEIATNTWDLSGSWTVYEVVNLNDVSTMFAYTSTGNKYTNGVADGTYTLPTSISFNGTTFDGVSGVSTHRDWYVSLQVDDLSTIQEAYNKAVDKGLLT